MNETYETLRRFVDDLIRNKQFFGSILIRQDDYQQLLQKLNPDFPQHSISGTNISIRGFKLIPTDRPVRRFQWIPEQSEAL
jgi:hypothetical protein